MEASKKNLTQIFNRTARLQVPYFQRSYVWDEDQWERFLDDMRYAAIASHHYFMGSAILKQQQVPIGNEAAYTIIDGQQRLTTFVLFFKALYTLNGNPEQFENVFTTFAGNHIIEHNHFDRSVFEKILSDKIDEVTEEEKRGKIFRCYEYFLNRVKQGEIDPNRLFANVLFVGIELQYDEDEQQIFDTINSLGVRLTTAELLKNYLFNRDYDAYAQYWQVVFEADQESRDYWDLEITSGRVERSNVDLFLQAYLQIKIQEPELAVSADDKERYYKVESIFSSYKDFTDRYLKDKSSLISELKEYANTYRQIIDPRYTRQFIEKHDYVGRLNVILFGLETATMVPYLLYLAKHQSDVLERQKMFRFLEAYIMRRMITRKTTKNYNNLFRALIGNGANTLDKLRAYINDREEAANRMPSDDNVLQAFTEEVLSNKQAKGVLFLLEGAVRSDRHATRLLDFDDYSLEHVLPKKWRNNWDATTMTEEQKFERDDLILTLGNLTIITSPLNSAIRDSDWKTKKVGTEQNPGLNTFAQGIETFSPYLERDTWDETVIRERAAMLAERAVNDVWSLV